MMLYFLSLIAELFKAMVYCLIIAFFFWVAPAIILEVLEEQREKEAVKHPHRRQRGSDDTYIQNLIQVRRENLALSKALTFESSSQPVWSL